MAKIPRRSKRIIAQKKALKKIPNASPKKKITKKKAKKPKISNSEKSSMQSSRILRMKTQMEKYALSEYTNIDQKKTFVLINIKDDKKRKVFIKNQKDISCNCFDFKIRCKKNNIICKHILYVFYQILKLDLKIIKKHKIMDLNAFEISLERIQKILSGGENKIERELNENDLCAICFTDFMEDVKDNILGCGKCKGVVHKDCMKCWMKNSVNPGCVYCKDQKICYFANK